MQLGNPALSVPQSIKVILWSSRCDEQLVVAVRYAGTSSDGFSCAAFANFETVNLQLVPHINLSCSGGCNACRNEAFYLGWPLICSPLWHNWLALFLWNMHLISVDFLCSHSDLLHVVICSSFRSQRICLVTTEECRRDNGMMQYSSCYVFSWRSSSFFPSCQKIKA